MILRWISQTHTWLGLILCLFFAMWFATGLVMHYVPYPSLTSDEYFAALHNIQFEKIPVDPDTKNTVGNIHCIYWSSIYTTFPQYKRAGIANRYF